MRRFALFTQGRAAHNKLQTDFGIMRNEVSIMKKIHFQMTTISFLAAFVIGSILFALFWKNMIGSASSGVVLAGMLGVGFSMIAALLSQRK